MREALKEERSDFVGQLLDWYDQNARVLPWRMPPGTEERPDAYRVWLSEIMLQQTGVSVVIPYFEAFTERWPDVAALAAADEQQVLDQWAGLGYYSRARNLIKCAEKVVRQFGGCFPAEESELLTLPGIGPYTAAAITAIAFNKPANVVDGNVERVMARQHAVQLPLPDAKSELKRLAGRRTSTERPGDYAQALMDLGATICRPRNPACGLCPCEKGCKARKLGVEKDLPKRQPKKAKPVRYGRVYVGFGDQGILLERRENRGLLGGMLGFPGSAWQEGGISEDFTPPGRSNWEVLPEKVRHTFTHFHLELEVAIGRLADDVDLKNGLFLEPQIDVENLPSLMAKVWRLAASTEFFSGLR